jgi:phage gp29-like protein
VAEAQGELSGAGFVRHPTVTSGGTGSLAALGVPPDAEVFGPPADPLATVPHVAALRREGIVYSVSTWTVAQMRDALAAHANGMFAGAAQLLDSIKADDRVQATMGARSAGLFSQPVEHVAPDDSAEAAACLAAWERAWSTMQPDALLRQILIDGVGLGASVQQVLWDTSLPIWQPYLRVWHGASISYSYTTRKLMAASMDGQLPITPGDGTWGVFAPHGIERGWMMGAVRAIATPWFVRMRAWRDWARFNERHGLATIRAYVPSTGDPAFRTAFVNALATMGQETTVMLPSGPDGSRESGYGLDLMEARDRAWDTFKGAIDQADMAITLAFLGQNLTTQVEGGSFAAARVHGGVKQNVIESDEAAMSAWLYVTLQRPFALLNFGNADLAPRTRWKIDPPEDDAVRAATLKTNAEAIASLLGQQVIDTSEARAMLGRGDTSITRSDQPIFAYHIESGIVTVNEVRARLGLQPIEGGDRMTGAAATPPPVAAPATGAP